MPFFSEFELEGKYNPLKKKTQCSEVPTNPPIESNFAGYRISYSIEVETILYLMQYLIYVSFQENVNFSRNVISMLFDNIIENIIRPLFALKTVMNTSK